jgi:outer membrane lipoprotein-sorting protein
MHQRYADTWYETVSFTEQTALRTPADTMVTETWREALLIPGRLRIDVEGAKPKRSIICIEDSEFFVHGDSVTRLAQRNLLLLMGFDVYRQPVEKTLSVLRAQHFAMAPVRTDMWEGREVYVIGAPKGDLHTRQLWIDRDRLLFVRLVQPNAKDSTKTDEYRFDNYKLEPHGWMSETVIGMSGGKVTLKEEYSNVHINPQLNPAMFVPPT